ncbi:MAG: glycosyltransferase family 39 protein [Mucilaginibacter sp.]|nr:glycosyltransferase family 39 protein [Mucilaginibacter sp.]
MKLTRNPYFIFLPFLILYAVVILINKWPTLYGDEIRYVDFSWHILHGYYSPPKPHIDLWNGPGYPLTIVPFMWLKIHALTITLMNAVYLYLTIVFLYRALKLVTSHKIALLFTLALAIYPNALSILPILYTEAFTYFLVSSFVYALTLCYTRGSSKYGIIAGLVLGYLTLTKIIFGYVLLIGLVTCLILLLFKKNRPYHLLSVKVLLIAFAVTMPYLYYTYQLTGKVFYWGNSGGMSLYWMSSPYDNEYGDWKLPELSNNQYPMLFKSPEGAAMLKKNHSKEIKFILIHNEVEQDALFKQAAIRNIESHPLKFIANYYYNCSRMLFNFPYSYSYQDSAVVGNIIRGSLLFWTSLIGITVTLLNWKRVIYPVKFLLLVTGIYLGLSGALSAYPRQLDVMIPILLFWLGILAFHLKKPSMRFAGDESLEDISLSELKGIGIKQIENTSG